MPPVYFQEAILSSEDSNALFLKWVEMKQNVKASIVLTHGMGEHSARYSHVAEFFASNGYRLCGYDLRGHGKSAGKRGHIDRYELFLDDLGIVLKHYSRRKEPVFLYGHSLGAQITLNYLLCRRPEVRGAIIASPWLELAYRPPRWKVLLARTMGHFWPTFTQTGPDDSSFLSRDASFLASMAGSDLVHHKMSARMFAELLAGARRAYDSASECNYRLLLIHGGDDPLTSSPATERFFQNASSQDKTLQIHAGMRHETHNEIGKENVLSEIVRWLEQRL